MISSCKLLSFILIFAMLYSVNITFWIYKLFTGKQAKQIVLCCY